MTPDQITSILKRLGVTNPQQHKRTGWVVSSCPLGPWRHDDGKSGPEVFGVKLEPGDPHTNCFSCGWKGSLGDLVFTMRHLNKKEPHLTVKWGDVLASIEEAQVAEEFMFDSPDVEEVLFGEKSKPHVFPEWWLDSFTPWSTAKLCRAYLAERGVSPEIADRLDLRWDSDQKRVCFPVRDFAGRLMGLHGRAIEPETQPRYRMYLQAKQNNPIIWLGENWIDLSLPIVVVEGPFDLASVMRVYRNVTSPLFASPSFDKLLRMADALEWITFFDRGTGGDTGRGRVDKLLTKDHVVHHLVPPKGRKDPGECSIEQLADLLSPIVPLDGIIA